MNENTNSRSLWESTAAWITAGVAVTVADAFRETRIRKTKKQPTNKQKKENNK